MKIKKINKAYKVIKNNNEIYRAIFRKNEGWIFDRELLGEKIPNKIRNFLIRNSKYIPKGDLND